MRHQSQLSYETPTPADQGAWKSLAMVSKHDVILNVLNPESRLEILERLHSLAVFEVCRGSLGLWA